MDLTEHRRQEIGSEFWCVPTVPGHNGLFPGNTRWFQSGRAALRCILRDVKRTHQAQTAAIPAWCCDSMITPFLEEGYHITFYPVYWEKGQLHVESCACESDVTLVMDYFGYTREETLQPRPSGMVIRDVTHSLLSKEYTDADYYFGSLRKWAGFYTGGFALSDKEWTTLDTCGADRCYIDLRRRAMREKAAYINKEASDKSYLSLFTEAEEYIDSDTSVRAGYPGDVYAAAHLDVATIKRRRRENARILLDKLREYAIYKEIREDECPLFVPVLVENRDALRRFLIEREIYCPVHWPVSQYHRLTQKEQYIYDHELSLVCDQRYGQRDMDRMLQEIHKFKIS